MTLCLSSKVTPERCMEAQETFEYDIMVGGSTACTASAMNDLGYFVIKGMTALHLINESEVRMLGC
jgi:hypothetical protein